VLQALLSDIEGHMKFSKHMEDDGSTIWRRACQLGLEGIVSKRAESKYPSGERSPYWVKVPCRQRETFTISDGRIRTGSSRAYLVKIENDALVSAGKLERGFSEDDKRNMLKRTPRSKSESSR
jgi:bifunctional non-homologous end joining protein LigD